jgi:hypothetical protein
MLLHFKEEVLAVPCVENLQGRINSTKGKWTQ